MCDSFLIILGGTLILLQYNDHSDTRLDEFPHLLYFTTLNLQDPLLDSPLIIGHKFFYMITIDITSFL